MWGCLKSFAGMLALLPTCPCSHVCTCYTYAELLLLQQLFKEVCGQCAVTLD